MQLPTVEERLKQLEELAANLDERMVVAGEVLASMGTMLENYKLVLLSHQQQLEKAGAQFEPPAGVN